MAKKTTSKQQDIADGIAALLSVLFIWAGVNGIILDPGDISSDYFSLGIIIFWSMILGVAVNKLSVRHIGISGKDKSKR